VQYLRPVSPDITTKERVTIMPTRRKRASQEDVNNDHKSVASMADRLGLSGEDREKYVDKHMTTLGHKGQRTYIPGGDDNDDANDDGGFFS
jgi:hypothetical protein